MPILTLSRDGWNYVEAGIIKRRFILHIERDQARTTQPRVRYYMTSYGFHNLNGFEGRVQGVAHSDFTNVYGQVTAPTHFEYELLKDASHRFFEITTHTPWAATYYLSVRKVDPKRINSDFEVLEFTGVEACLRAISGKSRFGDVKRALSNPLPSDDERREIGKPGPRDRFERIIDFGVKGVEPEPPIEEILDNVVVPTPRVRKEIPEEDLLAVLEQVQTPPKPTKDEELEALLALIK